MHPIQTKLGILFVQNWYSNGCDGPGGVLNFELGTDVRPEVSTTTL